MKPQLFVLAPLALTLTLPADGHGQAKIRASWLECLGPSECDVRVAYTGFRDRKKLGLLAARAASACQAAGYSHYVARAARRQVPYRLVQRVFFTHDASPPARPCSFSATAELVAQASEMARASGYPWPVGQERFDTQPAWTFEPGEDDWGEPVPHLDLIASPPVAARRSDQKHLLGFLYLTRSCAAGLAVREVDSESSDPWAHTDGQSDDGDRILEIRVDGARVKKQGQTATIPNAGMVASSERTFGVAVRSEQHEDNAAFEWAVAPPDRATIREQFPHCVESP